MHISQLFGLNIRGHKDIDFIDIDERKDTKLFLDPYVIQALPDEFCTEARKSINSFFTEIFRACKSDDKARLCEMCSYAGEPNETNLGMKSRSDYGKGTTADELTPLFLDFYKIVRKNPNIHSDPLALCMYIQNFAEDKMSDLITNILRDALYRFTVKQSHFWGMPLHDERHTIGFYWDSKTLSWQKISGNPLLIAGNKILLVPKAIVRPRYVFNVDCYIRQYIHKTLQEEHLRRNSELCSIITRANGVNELVPPTRKELYEREVRGKTPKNYAFSNSVKDVAAEGRFIRDIHRRINNGYGAITDAQLDIIVYRIDDDISA